MMSKKMKITLIGFAMSVVIAGAALAVPACPFGGPGPRGTENCMMNMEQLSLSAGQKLAIDRIQDEWLTQNGNELSTLALLKKAEHAGEARWKMMQITKSRFEMMARAYALLDNDQRALALKIAEDNAKRKPGKANPFPGTTFRFNNHRLELTKALLDNDQASFAKLAKQEVDIQEKMMENRKQLAEQKGPRAPRRPRQVK